VKNTRKRVGFGKIDIEQKKEKIQKKDEKKERGRLSYTRRLLDRSNIGIK
jgi:hypothetical protein